MVNDSSTRTVGWLAILTGVTSILGMISLAVFFIVGGPWGTLNDVANALEAILLAVIAWKLYPLPRATAARLNRFALASALFGAVIAVFGSALIISRTTGWFLAGLVSSFGYAFLGMWLFGLNYAAGRRKAWPPRLVQWGLITGGIMVIGLLTGLGIRSRMDDMGAAPWFVSLGLVGGLGSFILLPLWCLWLGRLLLSGRLKAPAVTRVSYDPLARPRIP